MPAAADLIQNAMSATHEHMSPLATYRLLLANPGTWVLCEGASWSEIGAAPHVDFMVAHM